MKLSRKEVIILIITCFFGFILVYTPHISNPYPVHVDEWHHIDEAIKLKQGEDFRKGFSGLELGFRVFLVILSLLFNLVKIYQFLPAIWATITALILFYITHQKTIKLKNNFLIAIFSMIFFFSIRSNVNITGLWFFTPLTFSIPFIFLYFYFFTQGIENKNKKQIIISLIIMLFLLFTHAISVLFAIPILLIYSLFHYKYLKKEYKFFSIFLLIPITGLFFYKIITKIPYQKLIKDLIHALQFRHGWGVLELKNSPLEIYSTIGYILLIIGMLFILSKKQHIKRYLIYILWPSTLIISILVFRVTNISYLSPYQRNLYYLAISLPFLSSLGLYTLLKTIEKLLRNKKRTIYILKTVLIILIIILAFNNYFDINNQVRLYQIVNNNDYKALKYLKDYSESRIMAPISTSTAIFAITEKHSPVGTIYFYGNRKAVENFYNTQNCQTKEEILKKEKAKYIYSKTEIDCNWKIIYEKNNILIYEFD
jgi:hypothetical protein